MKQYSHPETIKIFLEHGDPKGLRTVELSNWTGKAITAPRTELKELLSQPELGRSGIYFLTGYDPKSEMPAVYIGEGDVVSRIKKHVDKDFWTNITAFISKDENLNKAHTLYLEGKLIERANANSGIKVVNSNISASKLPKSEAAEMDFFLEKILQLLPVIGINHFEEIVQTSSNDQNIMYSHIKSLTAKGKRTREGFIVFKGSQAVLTHRTSAAKAIRRIRESLIDKGILIAENDHYIFAKDYEFTSPSTAGAVVHGGNVNGLRIWKNSDGKSLADLEDSITN